MIIYNNIYIKKKLDRGFKSGKNIDLLCFKTVSSTVQLNRIQLSNWRVRSIILAFARGSRTFVDPSLKIVQEISANHRLCATVLYIDMRIVQQYCILYLYIVFDWASASHYFFYPRNRYMELEHFEETTFFFFFIFDLMITVTQTYFCTFRRVGTLPLPTQA